MEPPKTGGRKKKDADENQEHPLVFLCVLVCILVFLFVLVSFAVATRHPTHTPQTHTRRKKDENEKSTFFRGCCVSICMWFLCCSCINHSTATHLTAQTHTKQAKRGTWMDLPEKVLSNLEPQVQ